MSRPLFKYSTFILLLLCNCGGLTHPPVACQTEIIQNNSTLEKQPDPPPPPPTAEEQFVSAYLNNDDNPLKQAQEALCFLKENPYGNFKNQAEYFSALALIYQSLNKIDSLYEALTLRNSLLELTSYESALALQLHPSEKEMGSYQGLTGAYDSLAEKNLSIFALYYLTINKLSALSNAAGQLLLQEEISDMANLLSAVDDSTTDTDSYLSNYFCNLPDNDIASIYCQRSQP